MILIFPNDPSTRFLMPIKESLSKFDDVIIDNCVVDGYSDTVDTISKYRDNTIIFIGHGFSNGLSGGCYVSAGRKTFLSSIDAKSLLLKRRLVCLSCRSAEFIDNANRSLDVAIGFGNIVTDKEDLEGKANKRKYRDINVIHKFRDRLVQLFQFSIVEAYKENNTFLHLFNMLRLRFNKEICNASLSSSGDERLIGELFFDLRDGMVLYGDGSLPLVV